MYVCVCVCDAQDTDQEKKDLPAACSILLPPSPALSLGSIAVTDGPCLALIVSL